VIASPYFGLEGVLIGFEGKSRLVLEGFVMLSNVLKLDEVVKRSEAMRSAFDVFFEGAKRPAL
jgi:hypothetical protein